MSKRSRTESPAARTSPAPLAVAGADASVDSMRETIESIVIAFLLAFLFRTYAAQVFQIPTGSMGPTLMGRHKDVVCPECQHAYQTGSSTELDDRANRLIPQWQATSATCPNCRYTMKVGPADTSGRTPSYKGDRIWVSMTSYEWSRPKRWDVAVFKFPLGASENYIKRIVGLPGETIEIHRGDLHVLREGRAEKLRKPPAKALTMRQIVHDNDQPAPRLAKLGFPERWQAEAVANGGETWQAEETGRGFVVEAGGERETWIRYQHLVPFYEQWQMAELAGADRSRVPPPRPQLITDFCEYNASSRLEDGSLAPDAGALGLHWVGDLYVEAELDVQSTTGEALLELVEGGRRFRCAWDLATGQATLSIEGVSGFQRRAATTVRGPGRYAVRLANIDDQLLLWVDDALVAFDGSTTYGPLDNGVPTEADLSPVSIGARGAHLAARHLKVWRDGYYVAMVGPDFRDDRGRNVDADYEDNPHLFPRLTRDRLRDFFSSPEKWDVFRNLVHGRYELGKGQYFPLGDNSPNSADARYWPQEPFVREELMIGKALVVFWPHPWPTWPNLHLAKWDLRVPFYPNFRAMRWIR